MGGEYYPAFTLRVPEELIGKLKALAVLEKRSANAQIWRVLDQYVRDYEAQHGEIEVDPLK